MARGSPKGLFGWGAGQRAGFSVGFAVSAHDELALTRALDKLPDRVFDRVVGSAVKTSMTPMRKTAQAKCPTRLGLLRKSLTTKVKKYKRSRAAVCVLGPDARVVGPGGERPANYAHLAEFGVKGHVIAPKGAGGMVLSDRLTPGGGPVVVHGEVVHHARPQPFLRPAFDEKKDEAVARYRKWLWKGIEREAKKLAKGG